MQKLISVFVICVKVIICLLLDNSHNCTFKQIRTYQPRVQCNHTNSIFFEKEDLNVTNNMCINIT